MTVFDYRKKFSNTARSYAVLSICAFAIGGCAMGSTAIGPPPGGGGGMSIPGGGSSGGGSSGGGMSGGGSSGGGMSGGGSSGGGMSGGGSSGGGMSGGGSAGGGAAGGGMPGGGESGGGASGGAAGGGADGGCADGGISGGGIGGTAGCDESGGVGEFPGGDAERAEQLGEDLDKSVGDFDEALGEEQREVASVGRDTEGFGDGSGRSGGSVGLGEQAAGGSSGGGGSGGGSGGAGGSGSQAGPLDGMSDEEIQARTPEDIAPNSFDDIVARQLREAALAEDDPELRERLWEEYRKYTGLR